MNGQYRYTETQAKKMAGKAILMGARALDMTCPSEHFRWENYGEGMIAYWQKEGTNYQLMVEVENDLVAYCQSELVEYVTYYVHLGRP